MTRVHVSLPGDTRYDATASDYVLHRRADSRIANYIHSRLGNARTVLNVGAGAGSYEPTDRYVLAVEPSADMRARRAAAGAGPAVDASAEELPFDDNAFDAAMAIFTVHQWTDLKTGLRELRRVTRGRVLILTLDPNAIDGFWLMDYLPERIHAERARFPALKAVADALGGDTTIDTVPIPRDCTDGFLEAYYARPEALLNSSIRAAQSGWAFLPEALVARGLAALDDDLRSGRWDRSHGSLRTQDNYCGPLVLVTANGSRGA